MRKCPRWSQVKLHQPCERKGWVMLVVPMQNTLLYYPISFAGCSLLITNSYCCHTPTISRKINKNKIYQFTSPFMWHLSLRSKRIFGIAADDMWSDFGAEGYRVTLLPWDSKSLASVRRYVLNTTFRHHDLTNWHNEPFQMFVDYPQVNRVK